MTTRQLIDLYVSCVLFMIAGALGGYGVGVTIKDACSGAAFGFVMFLLLNGLMRSAQD